MLFAPYPEGVDGTTCGRTSKKIRYGRKTRVASPPTWHGLESREVSESGLADCIAFPRLEWMARSFNIPPAVLLRINESVGAVSQVS